MKIVVNATAAVTGGSITYLLNIIPELAKLDEENEIILLISKYQKRLEVEFPSNVCLRYVKFPTPMVIWRVLWEQGILPFLLRKLKGDILFAPMDLAPLLTRSPVVLAIRNPNPYYQNLLADGKKL